MAKAAAFETYKYSKCMLLPPPLRRLQQLQVGSGAATLQRFDYFNRLPIEISCMIWDQYLYSIPPRLVQLFFQRGLIKTTASSPPILFVDKEARDYFLRKVDWTQPFAWYDTSRQDIKLAKNPVGRKTCTAWFRPDVDQLYIGPRTYIFSNTTAMIEKLLVEDFACVSSVKHLVVSRTDFERDKKLWRWFTLLVRFTAVETLTLVWDTEVAFLPHLAEVVPIDEEDKEDDTTKLLLKFKRRVELSWRQEDALREEDARQNNEITRAEGGEEEDVVLRSPRFQIKLGEVRKWIL
ncbi:hypothetical protein BJ875DRAFT_450038 [Amylocarpus encephaloides]|uniref:2EXR domain-containing protein n=1 Tax=Amylocarpus encephaloides TaxID=45428 RepID=A0A9P8C9T9_9HELO|nr:hypothetical protein BJ875DRAFT_450038 [Amylocarpus encephaloides]